MISAVGSAAHSTRDRRFVSRLNVKAIGETIITAKKSRLIPIIAKRVSKARRSGGKAIRTYQRSYRSRHETYAERNRQKQ